MSITLGSYTLSDGTRSQPARVTGGSGTRSVQIARPIRGDAKVYDRANRIFEETIEVSYAYATAALARAGWISRRNSALAQAKATYTDSDTAIGTAIIDSAKLIWNDGCGITISYHITGELT